MGSESMMAASLAKTLSLVKGLVGAGCVLYNLAVVKYLLEVFLLILCVIVVNYDSLVFC